MIENAEESLRSTKRYLTLTSMTGEVRWTKIWYVHAVRNISWVKRMNRYRHRNRCFDSIIGCTHGTGETVIDVPYNILVIKAAPQAPRRPQQVNELIKVYFSKITTVKIL